MVIPWRKSIYWSANETRLSVFVWEFVKEAKFFFIFKTKSIAYDASFAGAIYQKCQKTQKASHQLETASILPDVRPTLVNPDEFTPENFIWVKQQWDRVAEENLRLDDSLHIASAEQQRLETEIVRLSRKVENYEKRNIGHGRSTNDAAQQTEEELLRMTTVGTQINLGDQDNTENKPIKPEHQAALPQPPRVSMTDPEVPAVEQPDEHILFDELPNQKTKASGALEERIPECREEMLHKKLEMCAKQKASGQGSSSQTETSKGKGIACQTTMAHNDQGSMTLGIGSLQPRASNIDQQKSIAALQWENERLRQENQRLRNALEQHQSEDRSPNGADIQPSDASPEEAQVRNTDPRVEIQDADMEMGGITAGQHSAAQQNTEAPVVPTIPPARSEAGEILRFNLQRFLSSVNRDPIPSSDDARRRRHSRRDERRRQREQRRLEREEEARQQQREQSERDQDARRHHQRRLRREGETQRTRKHNKQSLKVYKQKKKVPQLLGWLYVFLTA
ncbi:hypothetical protein F52700_518 [Fusarium sp. NRRL 52700]|nr:hypothetical protein F52700_518 [Fusarium sp. NRRL 52700]